MATPPPRGNRTPQRKKSKSRGKGGGGRRRFQPSAPRAKDENDTESEIEMEGVISSVLAGTMFRVKVPSGHEFLAHISGKMRKRFIRLVVGDRVKIEVSPYDMSKARITFRLA